MKNSLLSIFSALVVFCFCFAACDDDLTYGDMRKAEDKAIASFIKNGCVAYGTESSAVFFRVAPIKVISEEEFHEQGDNTNVENNEYVLFANTGVYMQIVRRGTGEKIAEGESCNVICRFHEFNISTDTLQLTNRVPAYEQLPDVMSVKNTSGTYTATFIQGLMANTYGTSVPSGWLAVLPYINLGRQTSPESEIAKVRLIVPSSEGHQTASNGVYACFYEITMQRGR